ncbi:membrane protein [Leptolyngbya sp. Heron Island J]|nr:membrane protein [Leptolyngbya sp. Heron Island J]
MSTHKLSTSERWVLIFLSLVIGCLLLQPIVELVAIVPKNYNEGWNAFHSAHALGPENLYPKADQLFSNNYPPLSFYLVGGLGAVMGDGIIAGRLVALGSLLLVTASIFLILRWPLDCALTPSLLSSLLFLGYVSTHYRNYVAMNDPQMLAHVFQLCGVLVLYGKGTIRGKASSMWLSLALGLIFGSLLIKHNLLTIPLITTGWLLISARGYWLWLLLGVGTGCLGLCYGMYGSDFLREILFHSRQYQFEKIPDKLLNWLHPAFLWIFYGVGANWKSHKKYAWLVMVYFLVSLIVAAAIAGGQGVDYNSVFDVLMGLILLLGTGLDRVKHRAKVLKPRLGWIVVLALPVLLALPSVGLVDELKAFETEKVSTAAVIDAIATTDGPVMCEMLALCYWAGHPFEVDLFNTGQKIKTGTMAETVLTNLIEQQHFAIIQLNHSDGSRNLPTAVNQAIFKYYQVRPPLPLPGIEHPAFLFYPVELPAKASGP